MRHRVHGRKLGRTSAHRKAMFGNQLTALFTHERITTTVAKAKELRPLAERMVTLARTGTLANRRRILQTVHDKEVVRRLFDNIAPRFADRPGGYTRIMRLGRRRGDNAELAIIEFIDYEPDFDDEGAGKGKPSLMDRAKGMFGGRGGDEDGEPEAEEAATAEAAEEPEESATAETEPVDAAPEEASDEPEQEAIAEVPEEAVEAAADEEPEAAEAAEAEEVSEPAEETDAETEEDEAEKPTP